MSRHYYLVNQDDTIADSSPSRTEMEVKAQWTVEHGATVMFVYHGHPSTSDTELVFTSTPAAKTGSQKAMSEIWDAFDELKESRDSWKKETEAFYPVVQQLRDQLAGKDKEIETLQAELESHDTVVATLNSEIRGLREKLQEAENYAEAARRDRRDALDALQAVPDADERVQDMQVAVQELGRASRLADGRAARALKEEQKTRAECTEALKRLDRIKEYIRLAVSAKDLDQAKTIARRAQEI